MTYICRRVIHDWSPVTASSARPSLSISQTGHDCVLRARTDFWAIFEWTRANGLLHWSLEVRIAKHTLPWVPYCTCTLTTCTQADLLQQRTPAISESAAQSSGAGERQKALLASEVRIAPQPVPSDNRGA